MDQKIIIILIIVSIIAGLLGMFIGAMFAKLLSKRLNKKLIKNAEKVLDGTKENYIELDGVKILADKFRLRDDKGNEKIIGLKGGIIEDAKKINKVEEEDIKDPIDRSLREDSPIIREKKPIVRAGNRRRRWW